MRIRVRLADLELENVAAGINASGGRLRIHPVSADLYGGKYNGDVTINILDALTVINIILETIAPTQDQIWAADCDGPAGQCDGDGQVNVLDAIKIVNLILEMDQCP